MIHAVIFNYSFDELLLFYIKNEAISLIGSGQICVVLTVNIHI